MSDDNDDLRRMYDEKEYLFAFDLNSKDVTVTIESVKQGTLTGEKGLSSKKPVFAFVGTKKKFACNKTNEKIIAGMFGTHKASELVGKRITLYATTTNFGGQTVDCIRVRPTIPTAKEPTK